MATRRAVSSTPMDVPPPNSDEKSNTTPAVPTPVILKLLGFTFAMITLPIGTYFASVNTIFGGNATFAGATAAIMANVVLIGYIIVAMREDQSDQLEKAREEKKKE
ncbi:hypothetical protein P152DRAFT_474957 [Eremomyces bilateralis CBS 781.70]|uniref:Uncharacterized protein n=1 Tax=Eremomyces bilateralis CBS 781.70 TaxID=1392243 RepID=A0A6G1G002_9PEZI|nr:uncharacterized protein P152DRAFT_474957 [Eremomyces bilateralis CBS 781.70]KAF1811363.1 hypothetical protein P152DRAFT_474957 [Eremomyces bilateralis CBS 781.70]